MARTATLLALLVFAAPLNAHPVPIQTYDRTVTVRVTSRSIAVEYVLEVDAETAFNDVPDLVSKEQFQQIRNAEQLYDAFRRGSVQPLLAGMLLKLDGKELPLTCKRQDHKVLDHLRCEYLFKAEWKPSEKDRHELFFREGNFFEEKGAVRLSLVVEGIALIASQQPGEELWKKSPIDYRPGDEEKLRRVSATVSLSPGPDTTPPPDTPPRTETPTPEPTGERPARPSKLRELLLYSDKGVWFLLLLAGLFGAAHALTPGHGKALVAAYLVGERGTVWHAVLLGLVTALTHTGAVLLVAAVLPFFFPKAAPQTVQTALEFGGGLLITVLGFWLLLRRLSGKADHVHVFGGHHHHHDGHHHHHPPPSDKPVSLKSLVLLGIGGGIVPCGEAIFLFTLTVQWQRVDLAFPLLLSFSFGLALVLVGVGVAVVYARRFSIDKLGESPTAKRISRALPIVSAVVVTVLGLWLCYNSLHGTGTQ